MDDRPAPIESSDHRDALEDGCGSGQHQPRKRADRDRQAEKHPGHRKSSGVKRADAPGNGQETDQPDAVTHGMVRLIKQHPLQSVDWNGLEPPPADGVDVEIAYFTNRGAIAHELEYRVETFEARR